VHSIDLIVTLAGGLAAALAAGYLTHRLGLSPIVGYLFAGLCVGPYTPGFVADQHLAEQLAEVGVILLMFGVGLQFHLDELLAVRTIAIPGALVQSGVATALGTWVGRLAGWDWNASIVFGIALSVASTVVLVRVLSDNRDLQTPAGHIAVGWLVVEDILTVLILVLMPAIFSRADGAESSGPIWLTVLVALGKIGLLVMFTMAAGGRAIPWLLTHVASTRSRELFTLTVLVVALGIAVASAKLFGVSMALGAFLAGMVVGRSDFSVRAASEALPMRDAFAVLFFVSVGMLLDPRKLLEQPGLVVLTLAVILIGKPLAAMAITALFRHSLKVSLSVAVALAQIGEFSFIVATLGNSVGVLPAAATQVLVAAAITSITINPLLYRSVDSIARRLTREEVTTSSVQEDEPPANRFRAIVIGYGPIGRTVGRLLRENAIEPTIIELNIDTVKRLRQQGVQAIYGDASQANTLITAGVSRARGIIVSVAGMPGVEETIRLARELNPDIQTLVRTENVREASALRAAGADVVFSGEGEVALAFTEAILENLGATPEQIQRERARVHAELA
jgi:CPA2 family monovalent cation:H+ antiporter-2